MLVVVAALATVAMGLAGATIRKLFVEDPEAPSAPNGGVTGLTSQPSTHETSASNILASAPAPTPTLSSTTGTGAGAPLKKPSNTASIPAGSAAPSATPSAPPEATSGSADCADGKCTLHAGSGVFSSAFSVCLDAEALGVKARCMIAGSPSGERSALCYQSDKAAARAPFKGNTTWQRCSQ